MDYKTLDAKLQGRNKQSRKLANNTHLVREGDDIAIRLHSTNVVTFKPNGDKILNSGGWHTYTTKERINMSGVRLYQERGLWFVSGIRFQDGMTVKANGDIKGGIKDNPKVAKADRQFKAKVKAYAKLYSGALPLNPPDNGDCFFCHMITQEGQTLGDASKNTEHLDSHIEERYVVPSLAYQALKEAGSTDFIMSLIFNNPQGSMLELAQERVYHAVYKYILKRKGYAV